MPLSSFEEGDFKRFALNLPCSNCFGYYFVQTLITHAQGLFVCNI